MIIIVCPCGGRKLHVSSLPRPDSVSLALNAGAKPLRRPCQILAFMRARERYTKYIIDQPTLLSETCADNNRNVIFDRYDPRAIDIYAIRGGFNTWNNQLAPGFVLYERDKLEFSLDDFRAR